MMVGLLQSLPTKSKVVRTMPNTPVIVQKGVTIYSLGNSISDVDHTVIKNMLEVVGVGMEMQEHYMDIMTALSGGGPSFVSVLCLFCAVSVSLAFVVTSVPSNDYYVLQFLIPYTMPSYFIMFHCKVHGV